MIDIFKGYKGKALEILKQFQVRVWSDALIKTTRGDFSGIILPRSENDDDYHIVLKLKTGYNVGIDVNTITTMKEVGYKEAHYKIPEKEELFLPDLITEQEPLYRLSLPENYMVLFPNWLTSAI